MWQLVAGGMTLKWGRVMLASNVSPELLCLLVERLPSGAVLVHWEAPPDPGSFRFIWCNESAKKITGAGVGGASYAAFLGKTFREAFPSLMESGLPEAYIAALETGQTQELGRVRTRSPLRRSIAWR